MVDFGKETGECSWLLPFLSKWSRSSVSDSFNDALVYLEIVKTEQ